MPSIEERARNQVYAALSSERDYQARKWGESQHEVGAWIAFIEHHLAKARAIAATTSGNGTRALDEIRKVTALGVACMEQHGAPFRDKDAPIIHKD